VGVRRLLGAVIVVICIGVPLVESFDTWDHTLSDGNDTESDVVVAALCVGLALSTVATIVIARVRSVPIDGRFHLSLPPPPWFPRPLLLSPPPTGSPPPSALRI
jgi:hypothetical protein